MTIFAGICLASLFTYCLDQWVKSIREKDRERADHVALEQRAQFRVIPGGPRRTESWAVITYRDSAS